MGTEERITLQSSGRLAPPLTSGNVSRLCVISVNESSDRHHIMQDPHFWTRLAFTACGLLREADDRFLHQFWVDDFIPQSATDTKRGVDVEGTAWVGVGPRAMNPYRFVVSIPQMMLYRRQANVSIQRLALDEERHTLHLELGHENPAA